MLLDAGKEDGSIRPDVKADELLLLVGLLWRLDVKADWRAYAQRMLDLVMDALRPPAGPDVPH